MSRASELAHNVRVQQAEIEEVAQTVNQSTSVSWLWAFLFGPIYFAFHGFWGRAVLVFFLNIIIIGIFVAPFLAYPAWKERAREKAERMLLLEAAKR